MNLKNYVEFGNDCKLTFSDFYVIKKDYIMKQYLEHDFEPNYNYKDFYNEILEGYKLANVFGLEIIKTTPKTITTKQKRYKYTLLDIVEKKPEILYTYIDKIKQLIYDLEYYNLEHPDIALRNICVDANNELHLIDFHGLCKTKDGQANYILESDVQEYIGENICFSTNKT